MFVLISSEIYGEFNTDSQYIHFFVGKYLTVIQIFTKNWKIVFDFIYTYVEALNPLMPGGNKKVAHT